MIFNIIIVITIFKKVNSNNKPWKITNKNSTNYKNYIMEKYT